MYTWKGWLYRTVHWNHVQTICGKSWMVTYKNLLWHPFARRWYRTCWYCIYNIDICKWNMHILRAPSLGLYSSQGILPLTPRLHASITRKRVFHIVFKCFFHETSFVKSANLCLCQQKHERLRVKLYQALDAHCQLPLPWLKARLCVYTILQSEQFGSCSELLITQARHAACRLGVVGAIGIHHWWLLAEQLTTLPSLSQLARGFARAAHAGPRPTRANWAAHVYTKTCSCLLGDTDK